MTRNQRRKVNARNAQMSTGPKSEEGKARSRRNALKHGLTAEVLTLPDENPNEVQAERDAWVDALRPQNPDEASLVEVAATNARKLKRLAKAETAVIASQVRTAEVRWDGMRASTLTHLIRQMNVDPAMALIELEAFAGGVRWLMQQWAGVAQTVEKHGCLPSEEMVAEALRLDGHFLGNLRAEPLSAYEFALASACAMGESESSRFMDLLKGELMPVMWRGRFGWEPMEAPAAKARLRQRIGERLADLEDRLAMLEAIDAADRPESRVRALIPQDTPQNRLMLRYAKGAESALERSIKLLQKVQSEWAKQELGEIEAELAHGEARETHERNKAKSAWNQKGKRDPVNSYVDKEGRLWDAPAAGRHRVGTVPTVETVVATPGGVGSDLRAAL